MKQNMRTIWIVVSICVGTTLIVADDIDDMDDMPKRGNPGVGLTSEAAISLRNSESVLVDPLLHFSSNLFKTVSKEKQNVILSPISVHSALNLLLLGADSGSQTETELLKVLGYSQTNRLAKDAHESYSNILSIFKEITAIGLKAKQNPKRTTRFSEERPPVLDVWTVGIVKGGFNAEPEYLRQLEKYYNSSITRVEDGKSDATQKLVDEINKWAKEAGYESGVINRSELEEKFSILLLSAIRVQAFWFDEFYERHNRDSFYNHGLRSELVKNSTVMSISDVKGRFVEFTHNAKSEHHNLNAQVQSKNPTFYQELANFEFRAIEVPLVGNLSFTIFEPLKNGTGHELNKLEEQLLAVDQNSAQSKLAKALSVIDSPESKHEIDHLAMPPFKFESDITLKPSLVSLGLNRVFEQGRAELSRISSKKQYVSEAKHQAVIDVNKMGIKAAGITKIKIVPLMLLVRDHPIRIQVKNPFMFVIRYSKVPLFIGHLVHL